MPKARKAKKSASKRMSMAPLPLVSWQRISGNPPPISNAAQYVKRVVTLEADASTILSVGSVSSALGRTGDFFIQNIKMWEQVTAGTVFGNATFTARPANLLGGVPTSMDDVIVRDYGTANSRASVMFQVPRERAAICNYDTASTTLLASSTNPYIAHVTVWQYMS